MYLALLNRRYAWDNTYHKMIFKGRFNYVPGDGYYFAVIRYAAGYEIEDEDYHAMVGLICRDHLQKIPVRAFAFN